jgi:beta-lactamase class A
MNLGMRRLSGILVLILCSAAVAAPARSSRPKRASAPEAVVTSATTDFSPGFRGELERIVAGHHGVMGLSVKNLDTGEQCDVNGNMEFPTASTIKLAVMCTVFDLLSSPTSSFNNYYATRVYDEATSVGGAGFIRSFKNRTPVELKEALHFMVTVSDNTATNMLVEWIGGLQPVNDWLIAHGFEKTRMLATIGGKLVWNPELRGKWGIGVTTPNEMRRLLEMIRTERAGTTSATNEMMRLMGHQYFDGGIPSEVPPWVWVGSKSGALDSSRSDNAIVSSPGGTYVLSVYTAENSDHQWNSDNEGDRNIQAVSRVVWKHFNPNYKWSKPAGVDKL